MAWKSAKVTPQHGRFRLNFEWAMAFFVAREEHCFAAEVINISMLFPWSFP